MSSIENEDFRSDQRRRDCFAYTLEYQGGNDRGEEASYTVDDAARVIDSIKDAWVGRYRDLLTVRIDVPKSVDPAREVFFVLLAEVNRWLA